MDASKIEEARAKLRAALPGYDYISVTASYFAERFGMDLGGVEVRVCASVWGKTSEIIAGDGADLDSAISAALAKKADRAKALAELAAQKRAELESIEAELANTEGAAK